MNKEEIKNLLTRYKVGECSPEEVALIESWYLDLKEEEFDLNLDELDEVKAKIWETLPVHAELHPVRKTLWTPRRLLAAASILVIVSVGLYFANQSSTSEVSKNPVLTQIVPGGKKAILTLADGHSISLSDSQQGKLAEELGSSVFKTADGELIYNGSAENQNTTSHNTLSIPRGGYYILTLADGTKVWLNSESTLRYPTDFVGKERVVELSGEGYFEVAKRKNMPFKVISGEQTLEVLGTHFNVNAYKNENAITTTLLEGSVKLSVANQEAKLSPNQQSSFKNGVFRVQEVESGAAIAWMNNEFNFQKEKLGSIMRSLSRWYDVEVTLPSDLEELQFQGTISRSKSLKDVINIMEKTKLVKFKVEGRRITAMH